MTRLRLSWRFGCLVVFYGIQSCLLLTLIVVMFHELLFWGKPVVPAHIPWYFLNILVFAGPVTGIAAQAFYHPEERYFYKNHSLGKSWLWPFASLGIWLLAGLGSIGMRIYDGRFPGYWQQAQSQLQYGQGQASKWLAANPWLMWTIIALGGSASLVWLIFKLTDHAELPETDHEQLELTIDSVSRHFGKRQVLKGAWLNLKKGEIVGLLGRNGCGKSTLLQIIFGSLGADFRALFLNGQPLKQAYLIPDLIAYLPQASFLPRMLRVGQVIRLFLGSQASELLNDKRIQRLLKSRVNELSGGELRYLELGMILALKRPFVLLDEPFSELEPLYKQKVCGWIVDAAESGSAIAVTDHDYQHILDVSYRVVLMQNGQCSQVHSLADLERRYLPTA